jgi:hypothetical protein
MIQSNKKIKVSQPTINQICAAAVHTRFGCCEMMKDFLSMNVRNVEMESQIIFNKFVLTPPRLSIRSLYVRMFFQPIATSFVNFF